MRFCARVPLKIYRIDHIEFGSLRSPLSVVGEIEAAVQRVLILPAGSRPPTDWGKFESFTAKAVTARLAGVLNHAAGDHRPNS